MGKNRYIIIVRIVLAKATTRGKISRGQGKELRKKIRSTMRLVCLKYSIGFLGIDYFM